MKYGKRMLIFVFAILMVGGTLAVSASAQTRGRASFGRGTIVRPVIVRSQIYRRPYWGYRRGYYDPFYSSFYDPYWNSPYLRYQEQKFALQRELAGNRRELEKHLQKYRADGYLSPKEREELADDRRDVQRSIEKLRRFSVNY